jgi:adenylate cyclase
MSADPENEYFSDGIAEEILNALVKVEGLHVTARTSSFVFKGKNIDVREIGAQLGVAHVLEGSVRKAGNRVRITAQLVSCVDGYHLFSETYDRTLEDIFAVQDEIASKITNRLREKLSEAQYEQQLVKAPTVNMKAYETYLQGLYYFNQWGDEAMGKAIPFFEKAIEMENDFGLPHARLGLCYMFQAFGGKIPWDLARDKMMIHIERTRQLETETPEAYFALFIFYTFHQWDWAAAAEVTNKGLELFPNNSSLYHALSTLYYVKGDQASRIKAHQKGLELDPLSIQMILFMGIAYTWSLEFEKALPYFNKVLDIVPNNRVAYEYKGWIAAFREQYEEALTIFEKLEPAIGYRLHRSTGLGWAYFKKGNKEEAETCLQELIKLEEQAVGFSLDLATLYTGFGDFDKAFYFLEKAIRNKVGDSMMCRSDPFLAPLKSDPRFKNIEAWVGEVPLNNFLQ